MSFRTFKSQFIEQIGTIENNEHGFQVVSVKDICKVMNGFAFQSKKYVNAGIKVIRITNVQKGEIVDNDPQYYPIETMDVIRDYILNPGDLLMSLTGNCGRVGLLPESMCPAALNQRVACLRINDRAVDKRFLFSTFNMDEFENDCMSAASGSAQKNMSTEWLKKYKILLPPIESKRQFASFVEQSDKSKLLIEYTVRKIRRFQYVYGS